VREKGRETKKKQRREKERKRKRGGDKDKEADTDRQTKKKREKSKFWVGASPSEKSSNFRSVFCLLLSISTSKESSRIRLETSKSRLE
jgi:hypothetical protein